MKRFGLSAGTSLISGNLYSVFVSSGAHALLTTLVSAGFCYQNIDSLASRMSVFLKQSSGIHYLDKNILD
jgi:hypothetical protein